MKVETDALTKWATEMNPPNYDGVERDDPMWKDHAPGLMRGYNLARHHVRKLLEQEASDE